MLHESALQENENLARMNWLDKVLGASLVALSPLTVVVYGCHVAIQSVMSLPERRTATLKFCVFGLAGAMLAGACTYGISRTAVNREGVIRTTHAQLQNAQSQMKRGEIHQQLKDDVADTSAYQAASQIRYEGAITARPRSSAATAAVCQPERLNACSDQGLVQWGDRLLRRMRLILDEFQESTSGIEKHTPGWYTAFDAAQVRASKDFRECCAQDALNYHRELSARLGAGHADGGLYEWTHKILQPLDSKDFRESAHDTKAIQFYYDLTVMQTELQMKVQHEPAR